MIEIHERDGLLCPVIVCDHCGETIKRGNGIVLHRQRDGYPASPIFAHKLVDGGPAPCQLAEGRRFMAWEDLDVFLCYLLQNSGTKITDATRRKAKMLSLL